MADNNQPAQTPNAGDQQKAVPDAGANQAAAKKIELTEDEFNAKIEERLARDRKTREESLAKDLGMSLKDAKAILKAKKDADEAQKSAVEKLTGERDSHKTEAEKARLEAAKLRALARAGADPDKLDALLKRVVGNTPEEIEADVQELKTLGLLGPKTSTAAQGAGQTGIQQQQAQKTLDQQIAELSEQAIKTGSPDDWTKVNRLKAKKYNLG